MRVNEHVQLLPESSCLFLNLSIKLVYEPCCVCALHTCTTDPSFHYECCERADCPELQRGIQCFYSVLNLVVLLLSLLLYCKSHLSYS